MYDISILKQMIAIEQQHNKVVAETGAVTEEFAMRSNQHIRTLAAIIENDGVRLEGTYIDSMTYSALAGADTTNWAHGS